MIRPPRRSTPFPSPTLFRSWFEPAGRPGIARLVAQTMLRGTARRDAETWASQLDALGAVARLDVGAHAAVFSAQDRKSTRLNSSHGYISYAVFCLNKKRTTD